MNEQNIESRFDKTVLRTKTITVKTIKRPIYTKPVNKTIYNFKRENRITKRMCLVKLINRSKMSVHYYTYYNIRVYSLH